ncbi:glucan biosynthesis protein, partial [Escherichia coli]
PKAQDKQLVIYALLDSPRATGAYRFVLRPGKDAVMDVQARVFLRDKVSK